MSDSEQQDQESGSGQQGGQSQTAEAAEHISWVQWLFAGVSAALVLGTVAFLVYQAVGGPNTPPEVTLRVDSVVAQRSGYLVAISAHNAGSATAKGLLVEGELRDESGSVETSQTTLDYVPSDATREAGLFFSRDPRRYRLRLRPQGYDRP